MTVYELRQLLSLRAREDSVVRIQEAGSTFSVEVDVEDIEVDNEAKTLTFIL
jgi:hypothetical protein